jgi:lipopolysaccharide transport system ATP-binding protein
MTETLIKVENLSKKFCRNLRKSLWYGMQDLGEELVGRFHGGYGELRHDEFWAVKDVSFELRRGECLGLIGHNGAGKTTLLRLLNGLIKPDQGRIEIKGSVGAMIALGAGFNPILTGRENIYVSAAVLGLTGLEIESRIDEIIAFSELDDFIDSPVQNYSSGMQMRLGFSIASALNPDVLLLDEILAVGDTAFRSKCFQRIGKVLERAAVIFVSHSEAQVNRICDSILLLDSGTVRYQGDTAEGLRQYREVQRLQVPACRVVTDPNVTTAALQYMPESIVWGGMLEIQIILDLRAHVTLGLVLVHFSLDNEYKANSEIRLGTDGAMMLDAGRHVLQCTVGPLHLAHGRYQTSVSIFDAAGKKTIAHMLDVASMVVIGPVSGGVSHLIPMVVQVLDTQ